MIVNGSGAFIEPQSGPREGRVSIVTADNTAWRSYVPRTCPPKVASGSTAANSSSPLVTIGQSPSASQHESPASNAAGGARQAVPAPGPACCRKAAYLLEGNNEERLIHQHLGLQWCHAAILRSEKRRAAAFEVIVFARPDLVWWKPLPMTCAHAPPSSGALRPCALPPALPPALASCSTPAPLLLASCLLLFRGPRSRSRRSPRVASPSQQRERATSPSRACRLHPPPCARSCELSTLVRTNTMLSCDQPGCDMVRALPRSTHDPDDGSPSRYARSQSSHFACGGAVAGLGRATEVHGPPDAAGSHAP